MGSGGGGSSTNTQVEQIPAYEQQFSQANQNIAASIASTPYPTYQGQLIAGMTPQQTQGMQMAGQAATSYQPDLNTAQDLTMASTQPWNAQTASQYMSPYAMSALAPQLQQAQTELGQQQMQTNAQATEAGAFGDSRQGVENSLNNFYGDTDMNNIVSQGMNTAYTTGQSAYQAQQQAEQGAAGQMTTAAQQQQGLGETGAQSLYSSGAQQQQLNQSQLTEAYNNFLNQTNWNQNELGVRESALSNSPYDNTNYLSLAPNNSSAANLGAFSSLAGLLGGGSSSSGITPNISGAQSDIRLKRDIKRIGKTARNIPVYLFKYIWDDIERMGVMAQDVLKIIPEAVYADKEGYLMVDYGRIQ